MAAECLRPAATRTARITGAADDESMTAALHLEVEVENEVEEEVEKRVEEDEVIAVWIVRTKGGSVAFGPYEIEP